MLYHDNKAIERIFSRPFWQLKFHNGKNINSQLNLAYIMMDSNYYEQTKMKSLIKITFLNILLVGAFSFPSINTPKSYQKPNSNIEPFLTTRKEAAVENLVKITKRSYLRPDRKTKTSKTQNHNLHPRRRKQLNIITAYFS